MMKTLLVLIFSFSAAAQSNQQIGIQSRPCDSVQGGLNLSMDFGGLCKYETANSSLPPAGPNRVIYLGDSITEFWRNKIVGIDPNDTINRGYSGQTTIQMQIRLRADVLKLKPKIMHFMAGTNDIAGNTGPTTLERIKDAITSICEEAQNNGIRVVIGSVLPASSFSWRAGMKPANDIRLLNQWIKAFAARKGMVYADYYSAMVNNEGGLPKQYSDDGVHPNANGYALMAPIAEAAIREANQ